MNKLLLFLSVLSLSSLKAQNVSLNKSFGVNGVSSINAFNANLSVNVKFIELKDGKVLTLGEYQKDKSTRYSFFQKFKSSGELDSFWGENGKVFLNVKVEDITPWIDNQYLVVLGRNIQFFDVNTGKIGNVFSQNNFWIRSLHYNPTDTSLVALSYNKVWRIKKNGVLDTTFVSDGILNRIRTSWGTSYDILLNHVLLTADKKIVVTGHVHEGFFNKTNVKSLVGRLKSNGALDSSFNKVGMFVLNESNLNPYGQVGLQTVALDDKSYVVAVNSYSTIGDLSLMKLKNNGTVDSSFHSSQFQGYIEPSILGLKCLQCTEGKFPLLVNNNAIYIAGVTNFSDDRIQVKKISSSGVLDNVFNQSFANSASFGGHPAYMAALGNNAFLIAGGSTKFFGKFPGASLGYGFNSFLLKAGFNATVDTNFRSNKNYYTINGKSSEVNSLLVQNSDGNLVRLGRSYATASFNLSNGGANINENFSAQVIDPANGSVKGNYLKWVNNYSLNYWNDVPTFLKSIEVDTQIYTFASVYSDFRKRTYFSVIRQNKKGHLLTDSTEYASSAIQVSSISPQWSSTIKDIYLTPQKNFIVLVNGRDSASFLSKYHLFKLNATAKVDSSFGTNGYKTLIEEPNYIDTGYSDFYSTISGNTLFLAYHKYYGEYPQSYTDLVFQAFDLDGNQKNIFNSGNKKIYPVFDSPMEFTSDGSLYAYNNELYFVSRITLNDTIKNEDYYRFSIEKFDLTGQRLTGFGSGGRVITAVDTPTYIDKSVSNFIPLKEGFSLLIEEVWYPDYTSKYRYSLISPLGEQLFQDTIGGLIPRRYVYNADENAIYFVYDERGTANIAKLKIDKTYTSVKLEQLNTGFVNIYPNPVSQMLNVALKNEHSKVYMQIYDINGALMLDNRVIEGTRHTLIDVSNLKPGVYLLKCVSSTGEKETLRFIKI